MTGEEVGGPDVGVRRAELVALLSLGTDLGLGQPMEHMIRACLIALRLGEHVGISDQQRTVVYYSGLLAWVGCHTDAYEQAKWFGDDICSRGDAHYAFDMGRAGPTLAFLARHVGGQGQSLAARTRTGVAFVADGRRDLLAMAENHYRAADLLASRLGLGDDVRESLRETYERWDGKGAFQLRGEEIATASRLINLADVVEVFGRAGGVEAAVAVARDRRGGQFDPELVDTFCDLAPILLSEVDVTPSWDAVIASEPALESWIAGDALDSALAAVGEFAELKSPWTMGHAPSVAELSEQAAVGLGLPEADVTLVRRAGLVQDLGRLGVPNQIWDKPGPLSHAEVERVRLHPHLTERMLAFSSGLSELGSLAVQHHERLDGSGYPRGLAGDQISTGGRLLAVADAYQAMTQPRPHRMAMTPDAAAAELRGEVKAGRLDGDAVDGVLRAAGHRVRRQREWPAGLTKREVEVLRLVTRGLSNKQIAATLGVTPKTASSHVEHIYAKTATTNRAQASVFAMRHGLMADTVATDVT
ncbi:MAG TPA: HD domain-containing phosphohydrolase [Actinomycetes bacterium]|nr:HD domain-containing phosphohydrolase [Actinomycetes bacterium]